MACLKVFDFLSDIFIDKLFHKVSTGLFIAYLLTRFNLTRGWTAILNVTINGYDVIFLVRIFILITEKKN